MDFPEKALNAYLFNVEYGYAPSGVTECKKNPTFSIFAKKDPYWTENENDIRQKDNLVEMEMLNKKYKKESLKEKLKSTLKKYQKNTEWTTSRDYIPRVKELLKSINNEKLKRIDIPFYCNDGKKFIKKGTYEVTNLAEILYVTEFEQKLYHLELMFRNEVYEIDKENFDFSETFKRIYDDEDYKIKLVGDIDIYNSIEDRKGWDSKERKTQRKERDEFNKYMESIYYYVPMRRWRSMPGRIKKKVKWLAIENQIRTYSLFNNVLSRAFDVAATKAGWEDLNLYGNTNTFLSCVFNELEGRSWDNGWATIETYMNRIPDKTPEQLKTMEKGLDEFDYKKIDIEVDEKFVQQYVKDYTYKIKFTVNADGLLAHDKWLDERSKSFVGPLTVKRKNDTIEFFGGTLLEGWDCKVCVKHYGYKHTFTGKQLDIKTYKYENYFVLKNLIPEKLWDQAEVNEIETIFLGYPDYFHKRKYEDDDQDRITVPREPDPNKYKPQLKF